MTHWKYYALGSAFFAGLTAILAKVGVRDIPSNLATLIRTMVILLFLGFLVASRGEWRSPLALPRLSLVFLVLSGIATGLSWICYFAALKHGPASLVAPIDKLSLGIAVLLSVVLLGERLTGPQWMGAGLMVLGTVLIARF
jgi:bacterial/archaeal transporter family protein